MSLFLHKGSLDENCEPKIKLNMIRHLSMKKPGEDSVTFTDSPKIKMFVSMGITESLCCTAEIGTTL